MHFIIELIWTLLLPDFPSGSSINFHQDKLYIIGDDAKDILILDKTYQKVGTLNLFASPGVRIPKPEKTDLETSSIIQFGDGDHLLALGSASLKQRQKGILIPLHHDQLTEAAKFIDLSTFVGRVKEKVVGEINIEGSTVINNQFVLGSRANRNNPANTLIITSSNFWEAQEQCALSTAKLILPAGDNVIGLSELCYVQSRDLLLLTLTTEHTSNAYDDGVIGDSYLAWVEQISKKLVSSSIKVDGVINLRQVDQRLKGQKIEGLCVSDITADSLIIHMASDNDMGQTQLFKVRLTNR